MARPAAGTPYHRMARTRKYRWWTPVLAVVSAVVLIVVVQVVMGMAALIIAVLNGVTSTADSFFGAVLPDLVFQLLVVATMAPIVFFTAWLVQRRPLGTLFSVEGRLRWRWLLVCSLAAIPPLLISFTVMFGLLQISAPGSPFLGAFNGADDFVLAILVIVALVPFQAAAEEFALRGFLMQAVGSYGADRAERRGGTPVSRFLRTPVLAIIVSGTVFTLLHDYFGWGLLDVAVFGIAMAWLTWYTGGLEAAVGLHVLHNLVAFSITAYEGTLEDAATGGGSWQGVVGTMVEVALYCLVVVWLARRMGIHRTVPGDRADPGAWPDASAPGTPPMWGPQHHWGPEASRYWGPRPPGSGAT
ncbi:MAG: type II CAAX endopeptidase family protein [Nocardiopsaceae bacterium]|nr:type II CAAX endopeptidase family protein [Nocardiopsaceae bacterium]